MVSGLGYYQFRVLANPDLFLQLQFFQFGIVALFIVALLSRPQREFKDRYCGWLLAICFLSVFIHTKSVLLFWNILLGFILYYLVVIYTKNIKKILWAVISVSALNSVFAVIQFINTANRVDGLMRISNHLGIYQAMALPISYLMNPYLIIIPLAGLLLAKNITAFCAGIVGMVYLLRKKFTVGIMWRFLSISVLILFTAKNFKPILYKFLVRWEIWREAINNILQKWQWGYGIGGFQFYKAGLGQSANPYNLYLQVFYFLGIFGLPVFLFFLVDKFLNYKDKTARALFASFLIILTAGLAQCVLDFPRLAGTIIVLTAFLTIKKTEEEYRKGVLQNGAREIKI